MIGSCYNGYYRSKWIWQLQFKSLIWLFIFDMVPIPRGKVGIQIFSFQIKINSSIDRLANSAGDRSSIPARVIPKTQKMVLDTTLFKTLPYKVRIKGKVEQSRERSTVLPYTPV